MTHTLGSTRTALLLGLPMQGGDAVKNAALQQIVRGPISTLDVRPAAHWPFWMRLPPNGPVPAQSHVWPEWAALVVCDARLFVGTFFSGLMGAAPENVGPHESVVCLHAI